MTKYRYYVEVKLINNRVIGSGDGTTVGAAIHRAVADAYATHPNDTKAEAGRRFRIGVFELEKEIFWAWGDTLNDACHEALAMNRKSRACGGR